MIDKRQFLEHIIRPTLVKLDMASPAAEVLLLGTALAESNLTALKQYGKGPALGVYQMEPNTYVDIWNNYIKYHADTMVTMLEFLIPGIKGSEQLKGNLYLATAMARLHYRRVRQALPLPSDHKGMSQYHKDHYNTSAGKADPIKNIEFFETAYEVAQ